MLGTMAVMATIAVKDIRAAEDFYGRKLGLSAKDSLDGMAVTYRAGTSDLLVYQSEHAGGYGATVATWNVADGIDTVVKGLLAKGIVFEHYDMPGMDRKGDIHTGGGMNVAWFKDPDGNIICLAGK